MRYDFTIERIDGGGVRVTTHSGSREEVDTRAFNYYEDMDYTLVTISPSIYDEDDKDCFVKWPHNSFFQGISKERYEELAEAGHRIRNLNAQWLRDNKEDKL